MLSATLALAANIRRSAQTTAVATANATWDNACAPRASRAMRAKDIPATVMEKGPAKPVAATVCRAMKEKLRIKAKCPQDCSGHGICSGETCYCFPGYAGEACSRDAEGAGTKPCIHWLPNQL